MREVACGGLHPQRHLGHDHRAVDQVLVQLPVFARIDDVDPARDHRDRLAVLDRGVVDGGVDPPRQPGGQAEALGTEALCKRSGEALSVG